MCFFQRFIYSCSVMLFLSQLTLAVDPAVKRFTGYQDFLQGESEGIAISSDGRLMLGPGHTTVLETDEPFIYSTVATEMGVVYVGTGNGGKVFRVSETGKKELAALDEPGVYALALDSGNRLYAGTAPEGKVYRISEDGTAEVFFDPKEKFIWDLVFDKNDNLYVSTGTKGLIYKVDPSGKETEFFDSQETHIVTMAMDLEGNLLAGSAPEGLLYRISTQDKNQSFTLLDSDLEEMKAVTIDRYGIIYATALSGSSRPTVQAEATVATAQKSGSDEDTGDEIEKVETKAVGQLSVYRIERSGLVRTIYTSSTEIAFDIAVRDDGSLILATGNKGRIIALDTDGFKTLLLDTEEEQITRLIQTGSELYAATSNLGKLIRLEQSPREKGEYLSEIINAGETSQWGTISWTIVKPTKQDGITLYTRSGNTKKPNDTWSAWSQAYTDPDGSPITSNASRFLQWKLLYAPEVRGAALLSDENSVDSVSVTYQQYNLPPRLSSLKVHSNGISFAKNQTSPPAGGTYPGGPGRAHSLSLPKNIRNLETPAPALMARKVYIPSTRSISWKASDPNQDDLIYSVSISQTGGSGWQLLAEDLAETLFTIDGASFADGEYRVKVTVSDLPSNPRDSALSDDLVSHSFRITNRSPDITWNNSSAGGTIEFSVKTEATRLFRVEYSLDARHWSVIFPEDGITDSKMESYLVKIPSGTTSIQVRAVDDNGNVGTKSRVIE
jgi:sugar lactone lactonase YvrE